MKVKESLNVKFNETPLPKSLPLVDDDILQNDIIENQDKYLEIKDNEPLNKEISIIKSSKDHPIGTVIGNLNERTLRYQVQNQSNFFCFVSFVEPKNIKEAIQDESWTMALQEELNQFKTNDVWILIPPPKNQIIIHTKWVFKNKLDENGIVSRNKARLVAQGYNQQEGIDFDETYAPVERLESIRILLAYSYAHDFKLFQMDVKSAFLNGFINKEVYFAQPPGFVNFEKPNHVFKLKKALYGLKQAPKACSWFSKKQTALAISTTEAEYVSIKKACQQALWMKQALVDYDIKLDDIPVLCDNKGAIDLTINLDPIKLLFSTPPTSHQAFLDSHKDLPPATTNPLPPHPSFDTIEHLANEPSPIDSSFPSPTPDMKPTIPPFLPPINDAPTEQAPAIAPSTRTDDQIFSSREWGNLCMPISDALLTDEIKKAPYYGEYLGNVTKYQQYLNEKHGKAKEGGVTESPKATRVTKPKAAKQTRPSTPKTPKHTSSQPSTSTPTPSEPSKKYQDVQGKGKEKVVDEQAAHNLLTLQTPKMKSLELAPTDSESESDKGVLEINAGDHDEGHDGPNPSKQNEGQARSNPDLEGTDASTQQNPKQIDEEFTSTAYPNVQENLKLPYEDQVILEDPTSSIGTRSSLQNLDKELSFTNQFLVEKPQEKEPEKTNTKSEASLPTSTATTSVITPTTTLPPTPPQPQQSIADQTLLQCIGDYEQLIDILIQENLGLNLPAIEIKEILQQRMFEDKSYEAHEDHKNLFDALEKSLKRDYSNQLLSDLKAAHQKKRKRRNLPRTYSGSPPPQPPPLPPPAGAFGAPGSKALTSSMSMAITPYSMAWTIFNSRYESTGVSVGQESSSTDFMMNDDSILDEHVQLSNDEDTKNDHMPNADTRKDWWKPLPEEERPATLEPSWTIPSPNVSDTVNNSASTLVSTYEPPAENLLLAKIGDMMTFMN
uniref:Retrovirus-related Pol polyprotein from transposon TNT 1-94 n=1 Tax=Tanacetum cinerariifolium TaxID=118510 RepID=A0A6L2KCV1_TANCI|nr:retrovirus-related Pol polyprotein from transposon TNT 1-94 [Tanacetum cinerariifolium]